MSEEKGERRKPPKLRMRKRKIIKPDGRYLFFYEFEPVREEEEDEGERGEEGKGPVSLQPSP